MVIKERVVILYCLIHLLSTWHATSASTNNVTGVHIGVVLDSNSTVGSMIEVCMSMAVSDFYSGHPGYNTRLFLHTVHAQNQFDITSQVFELLEKEQVQGIVGTQRLTEGSLIEEVARKVQVPVISFTSRSQSVSDPKNQYFVRTTPDNSNQIKALAAICKGFNWTQVTILYEDTESGREFFSELSNAYVFQMFDIRFSSMISISPLATDHAIKLDLNRLMTMQNRVFLVHMNAPLGGRLFLWAKTIGMMEKDYAWIVTDSIGNFLNSMDSTVIEAMEGVIGIRAFVPISENLKSFKERWREEMIHSNLKTSLRELNVYGLLAYDTVWALAMAAEMVGTMKSSFSRAENSGNESYISSLAISNFGPKLVHQLFDVSFEGLTGEFKLIDGKLKPSSLEIFNVIGIGGRTIGYWTPNGGISGKPLSNNKDVYSNSTKELKTIVWPGDSVLIPKGWSIYPSGKLRVGIPQKKGFTEFVNVLSVEPLTKQTNATGFCIDIFLATLQVLPFKLDYEFLAFVDDNDTALGSYDDLVHNISTKYDMVVGDITILAKRTPYADFSLPYSESGIVMVVKNKQRMGMWVFFRPFRWDLWLTILATCVFIGIVLRILEHPSISTGDITVRPDHKEQDHKGLLFWFPLAVLAFPEGNMVNSNWSRFVLVVWLYMAYVLMQSYTAKLSSMFTVDQLNYKTSKNMFYGCQEGTYVRDYITKNMNISHSNIKTFSTIQDIHEGMSKGSKNGGYDAIYDEIPYVKLLLNQYGSDYKMVGPTHKSGGFGFAFTLDSKLTTYFSRAILSVTESPMWSVLEQKNFGPQYSLDNQIDSINNDNPSLNVLDFGGLFIIFGSSMLFAIFCSWTSVTHKAIVFAKQYSKHIFLFFSIGGNDLRTKPIVHPDRDLDPDPGPTASDDDSSREKEVEMTEQVFTNNPVVVDRQIVYDISTVSGQIDVKETNSSEGIEEIPQTQPNHSLGS